MRRHDDYPFDTEQLRQERMEEERRRARQAALQLLTCVGGETPQVDVFQYNKNMRPTTKQINMAAQNQNTGGSNIQNSGVSSSQPVRIGYINANPDWDQIAQVIEANDKFIPFKDTSEKTQSMYRVIPEAKTEVYIPPSDIAKMSVEDYLTALENNDQNTADAYNAAIHSGEIPYPQLSEQQRQRIFDYNLSQMPSWFKNVLSFAPGLQDSLMPGYRQTFNKGTQSQEAYDYAVDHLMEIAPYGYGIGKAIGNTLTTAGTALMLGGAPASASYLNSMGSWGAANGLQSIISDASQGKNFQDTMQNALINMAAGAFTGGNLKYLSEMLPQMGTIGYRQLVDQYGPTIAGLAARGGQLLNPEAARAATGFNATKEQYVGKGWENEYNKYAQNNTIPQKNDMMTYNYFYEKSPPYDGLSGHEIWQHSNQKAYGVTKRRLLSDASRENPVLVLEDDKHDAITAAQRLMKANAQTSEENIEENYRILIENGIPEEIADWMRIWAKYNRDKYINNR